MAALLLTTRGTPQMYYGEELGMRTTDPARIEDVHDPIGKLGWPKEKGRDGERTPMQWDASNAQAGFSSNPHTWLPVPANYRTINVKSELAEPDSILNWHRRLIALRRTNAALRDGRLVMLDAHNASVLSYARVAADGTAVLVSLNMSGVPRNVALGLRTAGVRGSRLTTLMANPANITDTAADHDVTLPPFAAWVAQVR
jgi:alpha-glucosidase